MLLSGERIETVYAAALGERFACDAADGEEHLGVEGGEALAAVGAHDVDRAEGTRLRGEGDAEVTVELHIDPDEQLARFKAREQTAYKKHKITDEDYRNREKWDDYVIAVGEMVARTSTDDAPWVLVPAKDKRWARIAVLEEVLSR